jgi:seryl-tRNA synthetase
LPAGYGLAGADLAQVWAAGVSAWLEVSSSSTFTVSGRRAGIRFRPAVARSQIRPHIERVRLPRTIIALLENGQQANGAVVLPNALAPYLGTDRLAPRA